MKLEGDLIKNIANIITSLRFIFAILILFLGSFSPLFWIFYLCGVFSDLLDGFIARKMNQETVFGAKLDSIADLAFIGAVFYVIIKNIIFPIWIYVALVVIIVIRMLSYTIGYYKFKSFTALHTYMNKAAGICLSISPVFYVTIGVQSTNIIIGLVTLISAIEELIIIIRAKELNHNSKSILKGTSTKCAK